MASLSPGSLPCLDSQINWDLLTWKAYPTLKQGEASSCIVDNNNTDDNNNNNNNNNDNIPAQCGRIREVGRYADPLVNLLQVDKW